MSKDAELVLIVTQQDWKLSLLKEILASCYREMGKDWCEMMLKKIDKLKYVGKP